jgi:hypothetical protein
MAVTPFYVNRRLNDDERRSRIFDGAFFLYSAPAPSTGIVTWARQLIDEAFAETPDPRRAHLTLTAEAFAAVAGPLKSRFTNDVKTKRMCQELIAGLGCDPEKTYFDLPRLRVAPPGDYLTAGVSYSYKAHRDTWYAHPRQLINFWIPVFDSEPSTVMSMYIDHFQKPIANASGAWDYDEWVKNARFAASSNVREENRQHPVPLEDLVTAPEARIVQNAGDLMIFSTCQLHASAPNLTDAIRFSYDLRTIHLDDLANDRGPVDVDGKASGTTLKDFLRVSDLAPLGEDTIARLVRTHAVA